MLLSFQVTRREYELKLNDAQGKQTISARKRLKNIEAPSRPEEASVLA
jgi:hypothetical protein